MDGYANLRSFTRQINSMTTEKVIFCRNSNLDEKTKQKKTKQNTSTQVAKTLGDLAILIKQNTFTQFGKTLRRLCYINYFC